MSAIAKLFGGGKPRAEDLQASRKRFADGADLFPITSQPELEQAVGAFEDAIKLDPGNARAHGWLAYTYMTALVDGWSWKGFGIKDAKTDDRERDRPAIVFKARQEIALAVREDNYDNYWAKAFVELHARNHPNARTALEAAVTKAPKLADGDPADGYFLAEMADCLTYLGDLDRADRYATKALARLGANPPDWIYWELAWVKLCKGLKAKDAALIQVAGQQVERMTKTPPENTDDPDIPADYDFDALVIWCVTRAEDNQEGKRKNRRSQFKKALKNAKKKGGGRWNKELELERHPFDRGNDDAKLVAKELSEKLDKALKEN